MANITFLAGEARIQFRIVASERPRGQDETEPRRLASTVTLHIGAFSGSFTAEFTRYDLVVLRDELKNALEGSSGTVSFKNTGGGDVSLTIEIAGSGKAAMSGVIRPHRLRQASLGFQLDIDPASLSQTLQEIDDALQEILETPKPISREP